jgi:hypothetical protein
LGKWQFLKSGVMDYWLVSKSRAWREYGLFGRWSHIYIFFGLSFWWRSEMKIKEEKKYGFM